ncbi:MAG: carboxypeptidase-like regulatory domain-containing protein [Gemmatimonadota bacterium]|jgi:hypothetical protein
MNPARLLAALSMLAATLPAGPARAQEPPGRIVGKVVDYESGKPLAGARVGIYDTDHQTITDNSGTFSLTGVPAGIQPLEAELIGYETRKGPIRVLSRETMEIEIRLSTKPIELPPLAVTVRSGRLQGVGFYDRRDEYGAQGSFITRADIERKNPQLFTDLLYNQHGLKVDYVGAGRRHVFINRGVGCTPMLWVDGNVLDNTNFDIIRPEVIEGVEIYIGASIPLQFHYAASDCGVIAVWTRRGSGR